MANFHNIVVLHPGAIGDVMLATPVAATLRANFPAARITYWTHPTLIDLLGLCGSIDECVGFNKEEGVLELRRILAGLKADLLVDLAGSNRSQWLTFLSGSSTVRYKKQATGATPVEHAVDNFLATLAPLSLKALDNKFPTLSVRESDVSAAKQKLKDAGAPELPLVGLVPGVGKLRSHRAWISDGWTYLARILVRSGRYLPVLIGGSDEISLCDGISNDVGNGCINLAGKLSLVETASLFTQCRTVVSSDTGPAHISVAVGTTVVGMYGPTFPERSGPYGNSALVIDQSHHCQCREVKQCSVIDAAGPGECMRRIMLEEVFAKLRIALDDDKI